MGVNVPNLQTMGEGWFAGWVRGVEPFLELITRQLATDNWPIGVLSLLFLLLVARLAGWNRKQLLARQMLQQVRDSNLHRIKVHAGPDAQGFVVESHPAPEPFEQLMILYTPASRLDPIGFLRWLIGGHAQTLRVRAMLRTTPAAELIWSRHSIRAAKVPSRTSRFSGAQDWLHRRVDFNQVQYSTRGTDTAPIEHVFVEFQTRFGRIMQMFVVRSEDHPHIEIILAAPRLDPLAVAGLLISLRSVGRAAVLR